MSDDTIRMTVSALSVDPVTGLPAVLLTDERCRSTLSIAVGLNEATAIAAELSGVELERPGTHQLMGALLGCAGVKVEGVEIHALVDNVFHARIHLLLPSGEGTVQDGRPSDVLALALHVGAEIRVAAAVLAQAAHADEPLLWDESSPDWSSSRSSLVDPDLVDTDLVETGLVDPDLADFSDEAFGKWKM